MSKLYVVGIGPGNYENMTVRADEALKSADAIIGYHVYVELVKARYPEKEYLTTPMTVSYTHLDVYKRQILRI